MHRQRVAKLLKGEDAVAVDVGVEEEGALLAHHLACPLLLGEPTAMDHALTRLADQSARRDALVVQPLELELSVGAVLVRAKVHGVL